VVLVVVVVVVEGVAVNNQDLFGFLIEKIMTFEQNANCYTLSKSLKTYFNFFFGRNIVFQFLFYKLKEKKNIGLKLLK